MSTRSVRLCLTVVLMLWGSGMLSGMEGSRAWADDDLVETGRLLAILLDSGRVTVATNQALINDPNKGDKGFTPEVFERQVFEIFYKRTNVDLHDMAHAPIPERAKPLLARLIEESKKTIASYQAAINIPGIKYKGLIPATFGTETAARFRAWSGIYLKQTAPPQWVRNAKNKPDEVELMMLRKAEALQRAPGQDAIVSEIDGHSTRVLLPLFYTKDCLSCHGEPKGERDISGYPREGGREGELGGGISVKIEVKPGP
ncbi:c-type heme family protein [Candidatus Nitrospira bockiana]